MKTIILNFSLIIAFLLMNNNADATLKRLNNNPGVVADYSTLEAALAGQSTWDTLYVEPSELQYNLLSTYSGLSNIGYLSAPNKFLIGNGYFLNNSSLSITPPSLQDNKSISLIVFNSGSILLGSNITCIGLTFMNEIKQIGGCSNLNLISCHFMAGIKFNTASSNSNILGSINIRKCYINGVNTFASGFLQYFTLMNFKCENNIFFGNSGISLTGTISTGNNTVVRNNVITGGFNGNNVYCANNIFLDPDSTHFNFTDNNLKHNIFTAPSFITNAANSVDNQFSISDTSIFTPFGLILGGLDANYVLKPFSPAIGAGLPNGSIPVDCGAFGGPDPYKLSGIPPFPTIYELITPSVIPAGTQMNISLSTRSNN